MPKLSALTAKAAPTTADELIITDKADSNNTKRITVNNLPLSAAAVSGLAGKLNLSGGTMTGDLTIQKDTPTIKLIDTGSNGDDFWFRVNDNNLYVLSDRNDDGSTETPRPLLLEADTNKAYTFGNEIVTLDGSGNLGVGTSSPVGKLHIHESGASQVALRLTNGTTGSTSSDGLQIYVASNSDANIINRENNSLIFGTNSTERMRLDSSGNLGVGTSSPSHLMELKQSIASHQIFAINRPGSGIAALYLGNDSNENALISANNKNLIFGKDQTDVFYEYMRLDASGNLLVGKTSSAVNTAGFEARANGQTVVSVDGIVPFYINKNTNDGTLVEFRQAGTNEGTISVSGTTVSYNGGHLARWSRMLDGSKPETLLKGTVMSNLDEMIEWAYDEIPEVLWAAGDGLPEGVSVGDVKVEGVEATYWEEGDELPEGVEVGDVKTEAVEEVLWKETDGLPEGVSIGDVKVEYKPAGVEDNEQLNHTAISSVEGDKDVAGVFIAWDDDDEYNDYHLAMAGDVIIRIAEGVEVKRGDLLVSAGDGTAKPQDDDLIRSSTVAKVTSTHVTCVYDDGSFCVPCVLK